MSSSTLRLALAVIAGVGWAITLPVAAGALLRTTDSWAGPAFVVVGFVSAYLWRLHMIERRDRIGLAGDLAGWLFVGSVALLGVSGFVWMLVAMALIASGIAYGVVLLVTQGRAPNPRLELATGLLLFAGAGASSLFAITTGLGQIEAWWVPAHAILAAGIGGATIAGSTPLLDSGSTG